ncbi:hypothetical protein B0E49_11680 [Polaromonas sp. C04]|nr:hypothetical protein B0E49_11680 [Polaromonas sp. C04]
MQEVKGADDVGQRAAVQAFEHISRLSGHTSSQRADSVTPGARELSRHLIADAQATGWSELRLQGTRYPVHPKIEGSNLTCRLYLPCRIGERAKTAILIAVALDAVKGQSCWTDVHAAVGALTTATSANRPPSQPWIAAMPMFDEFLPGIQERRFAELLKMMRWAGGFERCLGFGFADWFVGN